MTASQIHATTVCVRMVLPPTPVSAILDTPAPSVISSSMSATATLVRTKDDALTSLTPTVVAVYLEPQVSTECAAKILQNLI